MPLHLFPSNGDWAPPQSTIMIRSSSTKYEHSHDPCSPKKKMAGLQLQRAQVSTRRKVVRCCWYNIYLIPVCTYYSIIIPGIWVADLYP